jgi:hypothetical protein
MAAGDYLLNDAGGAFQHSDSNGVLSDGAGDDCCCAEGGDEVDCIPCADGQVAPAQYDVTIAGVTTCPCEGDGGFTTKELIGAFDGTYRLNFTTSNPLSCDWEFVDDSMGLFLHGFDLAQDCTTYDPDPSINEQIDRLAIVIHKDATTMQVVATVGNPFVVGQFSELFFGETAQTDCNDASTVVGNDYAACSFLIQGHGGTATVVPV